MKTTVLQRVAAPSPSVLSFLRAQVNNAFASPIARCAQANGQRRGYGTNSKIGWSSGSCRRGGIEGRTFATSKCHSDNSLALRHSSPTSLQHVDNATQRCFSTTRSKHAWNIFNSDKMRRLAQLQAPPPPPDETSSGGSSGFGSSLGRIMRPTNELKMRCTELDEHGNVTLVSGEFKKSELIAKVHTQTHSYTTKVCWRLTNDSTVFFHAISARSTPRCYHISSSGPLPSS
jgi:magnesium transporter